MTLGEKIKELRLLRHMTQKELGNAVGLNATRIGHYEMNLRKPKKDTLEAIADALQVNVICFMDIKEQDILQLEVTLPSTGEHITVENLIRRYEGNNIPVNPVGIEECTCPNCGTQNDVIKKRRNTVLMDIVYCWHCSQPLMITNQ